MNRAMFSGVAGLKTHQSKMDVIGNNIANVNTYGYKSQRAVFSDIFYQRVKDASAGTANRGGQNPSSVGYGSTLAAIQTQMTQSSMQNTGFGLDVAITGEGFLQVMDPDGNIFYTKAGMLDYDSNGYLTDINGNFVLGAGSKDGTPGTQKIRLDNIGSVDSKKSEKSEVINGVTYTITASNATAYGNVGLSLKASTNLPAGLKAKATLTNTGAIVVELNSYEKFSSMAELNTVVNNAIIEANQGKPHAAGNFTISANKNVFGSDAVPGGFLGAPNSSKLELGVAKPEDFFNGSMSITDFKAAGSLELKNPQNFFNGLLSLHSMSSATGVVAGNNAQFTVTAPTAPATDYTITAKVGSATYTGKIDPDTVPLPSTISLTGSGTPAPTVTLGVPASTGGAALKSELNSIAALPAADPGLPAATVGSAPLGNSAHFTVTAPADPARDPYTITTTIGGVVYTGTVMGNAAQGTSVTLKTTPPDATGSITLKIEDTSKLKPALISATTTPINTPVKVPFLGGASITSISPEFSAAGNIAFSITNPAADGSYTLNANIGGKLYTAQVPTAGGSIVLKTSDSTDGTITMSMPSAANAAAALGVGVADLVTGTNALSATLNDHNYKTISSKPAQSTALTGAEICGTTFGTKPGKIEGMTTGAFGGGMRVIGTSNSFTGSGSVMGNRDFKATYTEANGTDPASWLFSLDVGGTTYSASITKDTLSSSLLLKSPSGDYIEVSNPGWDAMKDVFTAQIGGTPATGDEVFAFTDGTTLDVTPATPSRELGLSSTSFALEGGTEGGAVTLDELASVSIGSDGTISVSHPDKGTVIAGKISLASFANPRGLAAEGNNYFSKTANSGDAKLSDPGSNGTGSLKSSALEMSNVDLSAEFADMITTQRGFQANSRIITVSDTMLEELINLKR